MVRIIVTWKGNPNSVLIIEVRKGGGTCIVGTALVVGVALMVNVLGEDDPAAAMGRIRAAEKIAGASAHWYGKEKSM